MVISGFKITGFLFALLGFTVLSQLNFSNKKLTKTRKVIIKVIVNIIGVWD
jgi:hypothetical protein